MIDCVSPERAKHWTESRNCHLLTHKVKFSQSPRCPHPQPCVRPREGRDEHQGMSIVGCSALQVSSKVSQGAQEGIPLSLMCRDPPKHASTEKARNVGNFSPPDMSGQLPPCPKTSPCIQDPAFFLSSPSLSVEKLFLSRRTFK